MITRTAKLLLLAAVGLFYALVVLNNLTDFDSNYQFVRHVLMMDSTFPANRGMWRAIDSTTIHLAFYIGIIAWEIVTMILLWCGVANLARALRLPAQEFNKAKRIPILALTLSLLMWLVAFLSVGAESSPILRPALECGRPWPESQRASLQQSWEPQRGLELNTKSD